jgi:hypothetical protein
MGKTKSTNPAEAYRGSIPSTRHNHILMRSRQGSAKEGACKGLRPVPLIDSNLICLIEQGIEKENKGTS